MPMMKMMRHYKNDNDGESQLVPSRLPAAPNKANMEELGGWVLLIRYDDDDGGDDDDGDDGDDQRGNCNQLGAALVQDTKSSPNSPLWDTWPLPLRFIRHLPDIKWDNRRVVFGTVLASEH